MIIIILITFIIGFLSAFVGSLVGLGGGLIFVPSMLFLYDNVSSFSWATPQTIVGISLITMIFTGLSSTMAYYKLRRVDVKTGTIFLVGSLPGSIVGTWINSRLDANEFTIYFGILMFIIFLIMFIDRDKMMKNKTFIHNENTRMFKLEGQEYFYNVTMTPALVLSFFIGALSGLFGIGGGTISVPTMILIFGMPVQIAIGTSMYMILFISLISASTHIYFGHIVWKHVFFFIVGSYIGGTVGAKVSKYLKGRTLEYFLRVVIFVAAIQLIIKGL